ncbi:retrovirus-related pol polyprotein from transposon TNT 1-94 [Tanacetum coccineum]
MVALSENPTIYDSFIKQFWQTATVNTLDNGEQEITAIVDGHVKTITISSVRKYLQLADAGGLSLLPNTEIFDQLLLMGKKHSHKPKAKDSNQEKLYMLHMDFYSPMRVQSINGRKYILVIVDDFSRFTWVKFLRSKDEVLEFVIKFLKMNQVSLNATVRNIRTDNGTEFVNQTPRDYYEEVRISHQTLVARTPQ